MFNKLFKTKRIKKRTANSFLELDPSDPEDICDFLDIEHSQNLNYIDVIFDVEQDQSTYETITLFLSQAVNGIILKAEKEPSEEDNFSSQYKLLRDESVRILVNETLKNDCVFELKEKMKQAAENNLIEK